jgi:ABC-type protease/lipase transport system fused ATPase/permease subunit
MTKEPLAEAQRADLEGQNALSQIVRQRSAIVSMGMVQRSVLRWGELRRKGVSAQLDAGTPAVFIGSSTRALRMALQIAILGVGAFLAVQGYISAGAIIASSIILGRGLAPIDQAVNSWRAVVGAWRAAGEVGEWTDKAMAEENRQVTPMPRPEPQISAQEMVVTVPGAEKPLLQPMSHLFERGRIVAILGASGTGKTSLLQTLAGAWSPLEGAVRLGGRDLHRWSHEDRGRYIGYLPQHVELLRGTVRENIARFTDATAEEVFQAARVAGCHDLIVSLPDGYDTDIGDGGTYLSAGQRQAIGLARAFFGKPPLILLDEPTAHLDSNLSGHLMQGFAEMARQPAEERSVTAFIATHDMRLLNAADDVMIVHERNVLIRPREAYLQQISDLKRSRLAASRPQALTVDMEGKAPGNG